MGDPNDFTLSVNAFMCLGIQESALIIGSIDVAGILESISVPYVPYDVPTNPILVAYIRSVASISQLSHTVQFRVTDPELQTIWESQSIVLMPSIRNEHSSQRLIQGLGPLKISSIGPHQVQILFDGQVCHELPMNVRMNRTIHAEG